MKDASVANIGVLLATTAISVALALATPAAAEEIAGSKDAEFVDALYIWLAGDDAGSLPRLAALANEGNLAAQILLGRINQKGLGATPWIMGLSRNERREIFRRMDTKFGTPWIKAAAETSELADAYLTYLQPESDGFQTTAAMDLVAHGEARAASELLPTLVFSQQWTKIIDMADVARASGFEPFAWIAATYEPEVSGAAALLEEGIQAAEAGSLKGNLFLRYANPDHPEIPVLASDQATDVRRVTEGRAPISGNPEGTTKAITALHGWLEQAPEAAPLRGLCQNYCPEAIISCADDLYGIIYGYMSLVPLVQSPVESIVSTEEFQQSKRAISVVDDLAKASVVRRKGLFGANSGGQACLKQAVVGG
jgi:hypothetical protein